MNCSVHPDRQAYERCAKCGAPVCLECGIKRGTQTICQACMVKEKSAQPTMSGYAAAQRQPASGAADSGSYVKSLVIGLVAAIVCAVIWQQLVGITHIRYGAVLMGILIGSIVAKVSDGCPAAMVPVIGAICAAVGIGLGEFMIVQFVGMQMSPFRLIFFAIGTYEGYVIPRRMMAGR